MGWMRYAIYWLPDGQLGRAGADWLGWDVRAGKAVCSAVPDTAIPRKYGFHATIKPPFRLGAGADQAALLSAARRLCAALAPVDLGCLRVRSLGRILALVPESNPGVIARAAVSGLDAFRDPLPESELARRRAPGLTPMQDALLLRWGYPYVMDEFRMHLTLTGADPSPDSVTRAQELFAPLAGPYRLDALSVVGEDVQGRFHLIEDIPLGRGAPPVPHPELAKPLD